MDWFRVQTNIYRNRKLQTMPGEALKTHFFLMALAYENDGILPSWGDCAYALRMDDRKQLENLFLTQIKDWGRDEEEGKAGLWDETEDGEFTPHKSDLYQPDLGKRAKSGAERSRAWRERKKEERKRAKVLAEIEKTQRNETLRDETQHDANVTHICETSPERSHRHANEVSENVTSVTSVTSATLQTDRQTNKRKERHAFVEDQNGTGAKIATVHGTSTDELSDAFHQVSAQIFERHPSHRNESLVLIQQALVQRVQPLADPLAALRSINRNHEAACASPSWTSEGGRFALNVLKWLRSPQALERPVDPDPVPAEDALHRDPDDDYVPPPPDVLEKRRKAAVALFQKTNPFAGK